MISISVQGEPAPKGSMKAFVMRTKLGKYRAVVTHDNKRTKPWQESVSRSIKCAMQELRLDKPIDKPVNVRAIFFLRKPKSVKRSHPSTKPDLDKLFRPVGDALEGTLLSNDSRIVSLDCAKVYAGEGAEPGVHINVELAS